MANVRAPAVAGQFYPGQSRNLRQLVTDLLAQTQPVDRVPKAIIAPHAGYVYSGPIAASAYASLAAAGSTIRRVILLGPSHRVSIRGLAASSADAFATPLGIIPVDKAAVAEILNLPQVEVRDDAHAHEHSLEVQLPFLQQLCPEFSIVPLAVGAATPTEVAQVLEKLWGGPETLIIISSDLSHYHDYETGRVMDQKTSQAIEQLRPEAIGRDQACGRIAIQGLLQLARQLGLQARTIDLRSSGDTAGPRSQVVGYGAYLLA